MPTSKTARPIPVAARVHRFSYAIRNIVAEAKALRRAARASATSISAIRSPSGSRRRRIWIDAVERAMRDGHNGYLPVGRAFPRRGKRSRPTTPRAGVPVSPDRVLITTGTSEGDRARAERARRRGRRSARADADLSAVHGGAREDRRRSRGTTGPIRTDWMPDLDHLRSLVTPRTRVLVVIDPNNPTGAVYPTVGPTCADRRSPSEHGLTILADEVYGDLGFDGPVPLLGTLDPDAPIISFSSLSKAYLAPGWRTGWMVVGAHAAAR